MSPKESTTGPRTEAHAMFLGAVGVLSFSLTLPATKLADPVFGAFVVGVARSVPAALIAAAVLLARGQSILPPRALVRPLLLVVAGVVIGFPLCTAIALQHVDSVHAAVITGLIPAATAGAAVFLAGERPSVRYWFVLGAGTVAVVTFAVVQGAGRFQIGDAFLLFAVAAAGIGYARGGALSRTWGGWRVICWALVLALPLTVTVSAVTLAVRPPEDVTGKSLLGFGYVAVVSMCLGFFAWYEGLGRGGVARVGWLQLAQPALTLGWSVLLLGERVNLATALTAIVIIGLVAVGRNAGGSRVPLPASAPTTTPTPAEVADSLPVPLAVARRWQ